MSTTANEPAPAQPSSPTREGYVWVPGDDGTAGHWERARANQPPAPSQPETPPADDDKRDDDDDDDDDKKDKKRKKDKDRDKDDDDDDDKKDKKRKKDKDRDKDDDDDDDKKDKDRDDEDEAESPAADPAPPPPPPGPGPVVRDHRDGDSNDAPGGVTVAPAGTPRGATVRDHRDERPPVENPGTSSGATVRDHRDGRPPVENPGTSSGATVRDHRDGAPPRETVRDHRDGNSPVEEFRDRFGGNPAEGSEGTPGGGWTSQQRTMSADDLDEFAPPPVAGQAPPPVAGATAEVRDQPEAPPPVQARTVSDDIVGDDDLVPIQSWEDARSQTSSATAPEFTPKAEFDDVSKPFAASDDLQTEASFQAFDDQELQTEDLDSFSVDSADEMADDTELSDYSEQ